MSRFGNDLFYTIKIKIKSELNINTPITTWILARLFDEEYPIPRKTLLKRLCQASFTSMMNDEDFGNEMEALEKDGYIEFERKDRIEHMPLTEENIVSATMTSTRYERVSTPVEGYVITEKGIIAFRKEIVTKIQNIKPHIDRLAAYKIEKFKTITETVEFSTDLLKDVVKLCVDNAPLVLEFIKSATTELSKIGIPLT